MATRKMAFSGSKKNNGPGDEYNKTRTTNVKKTKPDVNKSNAQMNKINSLIGKLDPTGRPYTKATATQKVRTDEYNVNKKRPS